MGGGGGFTIIELITVVVIILCLSLLIFANYNSGNRKLQLDLEINKVASDIRRAQEMGLSAPQVSDGAGGYIEDKNIYGYGIHFKKNKD